MLELFVCGLLGISLQTFILSDDSKSHFCMSNEYIYTLSEGCSDMVKCSQNDSKNPSIIVHM